MVADPPDACTPLTNPAAEVRGAVVLAVRGECWFYQKVGQGWVGTEVQVRSGQGWRGGSETQQGVLHTRRICWRRPREPGAECTWTATETPT